MGRGVGLVAVVLSGCVTVRPGLLLTELPEGLQWCGNGPKDIGASTWTPPSPTQSGWFPPSLFGHCNAAMHLDAGNLMFETWVGSLDFGLHTDERGQLKKVCVWGGNYGNATRYVDCVARAMMNDGRALPPRLRATPYRVTFLTD